MFIPTGLIVCIIVCSLIGSSGSCECSKDKSYSSYDPRTPEEREEADRQKRDESRATWFAIIWAGAGFWLSYTPHHWMFDAIMLSPLAYVLWLTFTHKEDNAHH